MTMKMLTRTIVGVAAAFVLVSATLAAHHGWTGYDDKLVTLTGTVKSSAYENPHGYVDLETKEKTWRVVLAPPARMESRGLAKDTLKAGAAATVAGHVNKVTKNELRAERITIAGKTTELR